MTKLYRVDMRIAATAYIKANSKKDAMRIAKTWRNEPIEVGGCDLISGRRFSDPALPDFSLSPAMTIGKPFAYVEKIED